MTSYLVKRASILWVCLCMLSAVAVAKDIPPKPSPYRLVNDYAGVLSQSDAQQLEMKLRTFEDSTSNQIAIVIEPSLEDQTDLETYVRDIFMNWGIGQKGKDNGLLIYVAIKEHKFRTEVGYGLNGKITAIQTSTVDREILTPAFRAGKFYEGLDQATSRYMALASGEFHDKKPQDEGQSIPGVGFIVFFIIIAVIIAMLRGSRGGRGRGGRGGGGGGFLTGMILGNLLGGGWGRGSGGGGFGGGGGGGFGGGGFGGGESGGGGSSGSW